MRASPHLFLLKMSKIPHRMYQEEAPLPQSSDSLVLVWRRLEQLDSLVRNPEGAQMNLKLSNSITSGGHVKVWLSRQVRLRADLKMLPEVSKSPKMSAGDQQQVLAPERVV